MDNLLPQWGSLNRLRLESTQVDDILYVKTDNDTHNFTVVKIIVRPYYDEKTVLQFAEDNIPLGVTYEIIDVIEHIQQQEKRIKELEQEVFETKVNHLDDRLAEYATSDKERADAWQEEFGMSEREAKIKAGWVHWSLYPE